MGQDLVEASPAASAVFDEVGEALGLDIRKLCWDTDELCWDTDAETLRQTQNAQVALFATGVAAFRALQEAHKDWTPQAMAGHSVGEYAALVSGGWMSVATGAKLVRRRGEIMAASGKDRPGTMQCWAWSARRSKLFAKSSRKADRLWSLPTTTAPANWW